MLIFRRKAKDYKKQVCIPLLVLMWKYAIARSHRYCHSFWEIFSGVSVFLLLFFVYQTTKSARSEPDFNQSVVRVFFTPDNSYTRRLINRAANYLAQNEMETGTNRQWRFEGFKYPLDEKKFNSSQDVVVVDFKSNSTNTPLEYSIDAGTRVQDNKFNKAINGYFRSFVPPEKVAPPHMGLLQWAIDKSYIEQRIGKAIVQTVSLITIPKYISEELHTLHKFMILCTIIAPLPFFLSHSATLIMERRSGLRELMKMSGICADILRFSHILETLVIGILYCLPVVFLLKATADPILPNSNSLIIAFTIVLHYVNTMSLSFITTAISQDFHHADCVGFMLYMSTFILDCLWYSYKRTYKFFAYLACIILPHAPVYLFWDEVLYLESIGVGSRFRNVYSRHSDNLQPVATVWVFFYIHLAFITSLAWYLDLVRPGPFGVSKRWNFLFKRSYWFSHKIKRRIVTLPETYLAKRDEKYFEKLPQHGAISIQIYNVSKVFKGKGSELSSVTADVTALDSVSFDCYQGEITLVLGDNGAGKTTLMHIVAGMIGPTCGAVFVNGINVAHRIMEHHEDLALCMQDNIYFNFLTVRENISFYKKLQRNKQDDDSGFTLHQIMKKLKLYDVADNYCSQLSSGTLRCVQVACVLAVSPDVLVLDEPTTGMDIDVKHRLWDMLFVLRSKKTIIMTTSCLEEAYALGDRIVILQNGALKCHGSPTFLKDAIGMSFSLSITIKDGTQMMKLKETVEGIIPNLRCRIEDMRNVVFSLPTKETQNFPKVFRTLEEKKEDLGIQLVDVGMFMEEVFMEFIEKPDVRYSGVADKSYMIFRAAKLEGIHLLWSRIKLLHQRTYDYLVMKKIQFLSIRVLVPTLCLIIMTVTSNYSLRSTKLFTHHVSGEDEKLGLNKLVYNVGPFRRQGLYNGAEKYPGLKLVYALDIDQEFQNPKSGFSAKDVAGFKVTDRFSKIFHPRDLKSTSKSVNMFSNIYMSMFLPNMTHGIRTSYKPILRNNTKKPKINVPKSIFLCMKWSVWVSILSILPLTPIIILCIVELNRGIRDNHMMAGCNPTLHWACKLSAHMGIYSVTILLPVIVIGVMLDFDKTFYQFKFLGKFEDDLLLVNNVHKEYFRHVHRWAPRNGVKGVTFGVKQEQCLAILGYQATGKSSLLNMLAGNLVMSKGSAYVAGYHIRKNRIKYLHNISLSSASGGMDGFMTGAQNLIFIAQMRGFESRIAYKIAYVTLRYLGIHGLQGLVEHYSAGCLRRLSLCGSLVKGPAVVFVDEPMRGIDPTSKVLVAKALRRLVLQPAAVIVAETSVAWRILQPVITRIAIMSKGQLALIGPAQEVLESIATGYTVRIKLKTMTAYRSDRYRALPSDDEMSATSTSSNDEPAIHTDKSVMIASNISDFKKDFLKEFPTSQQTGEHLSMLYFAIHDESEQKKQLYSDMFAKLQELQEKYDDVVEDCYLNATTIEDVFLRLQTQKAPQTDRHRSSSIVID